MRRVLHAAQCVLVGAAIGLGAVWPSLFTLVGLVVFPGFVLALAALVTPAIVMGEGRKRWLRAYIHGCVAVSGLALLSQGAWVLSSHSVPVDIIVHDGSPGPVVVVYGVDGGAPLREVGGRRVYEVPASKVLAAEFAPNDGWWRKGERRFFVKDGAGGLRSVSGRVGGAGTASWSGCTARLEQFIIQPSDPVSDYVYRTLDDPESWGVRCEAGRLTKR